MNEDKAFLDTLDADAQLIMKGKEIASLNALRRKVNWPDDDILDQVFRVLTSQDFKHQSLALTGINPSKLFCHGTTT